MGVSPSQGYQVSDTTTILQFYRVPGLLEAQLQRLLPKVQKIVPSLLEIETEMCFNVEIKAGTTLDADQKRKLLWLFTETFEPENTSESSFLLKKAGASSIVEVGPRLAFASAWSSNAVSMCEACGITCVSRIEKSRRYLLSASTELTPALLAKFTSLVYDRMTEAVYPSPLRSFESGVVPAASYTVPVLAEGRRALEQVNKAQGMGWDDADLDYYTKVFSEMLGRDPTDVELFDIGQSNSEHSRHWFFGGKMVIDGVEKPQTLFQLVKSTLPKEGTNSLIAFHDNSRAIRGGPSKRLTPANPLTASPVSLVDLVLHPTLTAETHNMPCGVAPFAGAETGTGGRLRDVQATGRGCYTMAGVSCYCVGNLQIPNYNLPWEDPSFVYANNLATPLEIEIEASNGASDYGNKYGEPVVHGFTRSFGQRLPNGERFEWVKPIMFTAGVGWIDDRHLTKGDPEVGMVVCKVGGPAYRIGMGGGAASSRAPGEGDVALDFDAVQRGDAEMENKMNRIIRACVELGDRNPIVSIHDQGAGGNGNVLKELVDPLGAVYELRKVPLGDPTMSAREIWGAEYQENDAFICRPEDLPLALAAAARENCAVSPVGVVTNDGKVTVTGVDGTTVVDLPLTLVLGKMPQKTFDMKRLPYPLHPLVLPMITPAVALDRVLRLLSVGSKRFLTNKVDRSVSGCVAQQQCVGPLATPLANCGVVTSSPFVTTGVAVACGEQPIKLMVSPQAGARMTVAEALMNISFCKVTSLEDVKCSGNWMWAAKLPGEGPKMYDTCEALTEAMFALGISIDGGKDSLSMAASVGPELVKSPGMITVTAYVTVSDVTKTVTPDLKYPGLSRLLHVDLSCSKKRLGGTALAQVFGQIGNEAPDADNLGMLKQAFNTFQSLIDRRLVKSGHDISDGGLLVCILEMCFAGNVSTEVRLPASDDKLATLFNEELGYILEILPDDMAAVTSAFTSVGIPCREIGVVTAGPDLWVCVGTDVVISAPMVELRDVWEATSFQLERFQTNAKCVQQEQDGLKHRTGSKYVVTYDVTPTPAQLLSAANKPKVCILRQEGSNGDREMMAAFLDAGLEPWDVNMTDLLNGSVSLDIFKGIVFVGGFSYADVLDSAKGWAAVIKFHPALLTQFEAFRNRPDTFSLGICNGCQLMALLGWVPGIEVEERNQPRFVHNESGRFESRWVSVQIQESPAVMLQGMQGSTLGVWIAHGEGQAYFADETVKTHVLSNNLAPVRYVDDSNQITQEYPMNPNGSPAGIAGLCSADGRHLCMMPHPERCFKAWQWPYMPEDMKRSLYADTDTYAAPWLKMFQNAYAFCTRS